MVPCALGGLRVPYRVQELKPSWPHTRGSPYLLSVLSLQPQGGCLLKTFMNACEIMGYVLQNSWIGRGIPMPPDWVGQETHVR